MERQALCVKMIESQKLISAMVTNAVFGGFKYILESFDDETREQVIGKIRIEIKRYNNSEISKEECFARIFEIISKYLREDNEKIQITNSKKGNDGY